MKKALTYGAGLIGLYLVVEHWLGASNVVKASASGVSTVAKTLQGR